MKKVVSLLFISFALCLVLISCGNGNTDSENQLQPTEGLEYKLLRNGTYEVSGIGTATYVKDIVIPETHEGKAVTKIGNGAFYDCRNIKSVVIPNGVTSIGSNTFMFCINLTSVEISNSVTEIGFGAFQVSNLANIVIPSSVISIGENVFAGCTSLESITVDENNKAYKSIDGNLYTKDGSVLIKYATGKKATLFEVPNGVTRINCAAISDCRNIKSIVIPNSVTSIIRDAIFYCHNLASITVDENNTAYKSINGNLYTKDGQSLIKYAEGKKDISFVIPSSVISIDYNAFESCEHLACVLVPKSVQSIEEQFLMRKLTVYCEVEEKPVGWSVDWDYDPSQESPVVYWYSESKPENEGNYWYYGENGEKVIWELLYTLLDNDTYEVRGTAGFDIINGRIGKGARAAEIEIPSSYNGKAVTSIGTHAFGGCHNLKSVVIPDSVTSISKTAFYSKEVVFVAENNPAYKSINGSLYTKDGTSFLHHGCRNESTIVIPNGVTTIENYMFDGCKYVESIVIPNSVTSIGDYAFRDCTSLKSVTMSNCLTYIGGGAFSGCNSLESVTMSNGLTYIGGSAFARCEKLTNIIIPNSVTSIGQYAFFGCNSLESVTMSNGLTYIGGGAFERCEKLTNIIIPNSVTSIGQYAFSECKNLNSVAIPNSVTSIGQYAFSECKNLNSVAIPNSIKIIETGTFYGCESLTSIVISNSVKIIDEYAFCGCTSLENIRIPDNLTSIAGNTFNVSGIKSITVDENNPVYKSINGDLYSKDGTTLLRYACGKKSILFLIPYGVEKIGECAFLGCESLEHVEIPNSVTSIDEYAFSGCKGLKYVVIPNSVKAISKGAFYNCKSLENVATPNSVSGIGESAFYGCSSLKFLVIPYGVGIIDEYAFLDCYDLTIVVVPKSVVIMGQLAFGGRDTTMIFCEATEKPVNWDENWCEDVKFIYWYSENEPSIEGNYWHYDENGEIAVWSK